MPKLSNSVLSTLLQSLQGGTNTLGTLQNTVGTTLQNTVEDVEAVENAVENTVNETFQNTVAAINTISLMSITSSLETILTKISKKE